MPDAAAAIAWATSGEEGRRRMVSTRAAWLGLLAAAVAAAVTAQEGSTATAGEEKRFRLSGEVKLNYRDSDFLEFKLAFPFPPSFIPEGEDGVYMRTPAAGSSFELQNVSLIAEAEWTPSLRGRAVIHVVDLYNRNPTSSAERIVVREAWLLMGKRADALREQEGTSVFLLLGKAPRFTKQLDRRLESYGLWGTAVGRFEQIQAQIGGSLGRYIYWRGHVANGNPLFMRDPNALAGDFGTPETEPGHVDPIYESGFPILYDTQAQDVNLSGNVELGGGLGLRFLDADGRDGVDLLGWYFQRDMEDKARIHGTYYEGDLEMLRGAGGVSLPYHGREREEYGANLQARLAGLRVFGQLVWQTLAGLDREGVELEVAYRFPLNGLFASGDTPVINWIQPAVRYSEIDNKFSAAKTFVSPSFFWDWVKIDAGVRVGIVRGVDLTLEYARNEMRLLNGSKLYPDEALATLRYAF
jgi:hypothetical protein